VECEDNLRDAAEESDHWGKMHATSRETPQQYLHLPRINGVIVEIGGIDSPGEAARRNAVNMLTGYVKQVLPSPQFHVTASTTARET
jgi:hypothetical protein